ncbi:MAG: DUF1992 domain-containing protein [Micromonosporaceae bacterium]
MTDRKPADVNFESWVDRQIREAAERGAFENLPGAGKPLTGLGAPSDENWWVRGYLRREGLSTEELLPTPLRLRKEIEQLPETVRRLRTEQAVRETVDALNVRIVDWLRYPSGPQVRVGRVDPDAVVEQWRRDRDVQAPSDPDRAGTGPVSADREADVELTALPPRRCGWWRRFTPRGRR